MKIFSVLQEFTYPSLLRRIVFFLVFDVLIISFSLYFSFFVHFEFNFNISYFDLISDTLLFFIVIKIASLAAFRVYNLTWRYVGLSDLMNIITAVCVSETALVISSLSYSFMQLPITGYSKRIFFVDGIISLCLISALRISKKLYTEVIREKAPMRKGKRTLIVGAGNTGEMILRDMARNGYAAFYPIGFLDDDRTVLGTYMHGVKVLGTLDKLDHVLSRESVEALVIAIPSLNPKTLRELYDSARKMEVDNIKIVPRIYEFDKPDINLKGLEDISIEDLIGRQIVSVDYQGIRSFLHGKSVMITGAGGSIGAEIVAQVCAFGPSKLILFEIDETELHNIGLKLGRLFPHLDKQIEYVTGDVRDELRVREIFGKYAPEIVFHAAAYKHVPMMEYNPQEAVKVNIFGTFNLARAACEGGVEKFVMISTDKAVRPTSVMGATKRVAEYVCGAFNKGNFGFLILDSGLKDRRQESPPHFVIPAQAGIQEVSTALDSGFRRNDDAEEGGDSPLPLPSPVEGEGIEGGRKAGGTAFVSVRFGNVLGSRGSVLPLFLDQLKHGGPLTVTHEDMRRYFMTIPEAVSLVLQASIMGNGGEVFVLDMGEPVKIVDIAEELIRIHNMEPYKDIDIQFTGLRPGEKLFEEILTAEEGTDSSQHEKVFVARTSEKHSLSDIEKILGEFREVINKANDEVPGQIRALLKRYVKHYEKDGE